MSIFKEVEYYKCQCCSPPSGVYARIGGRNYSWNCDGLGHPDRWEVHNDHLIPGCYKVSRLHLIMWNVPQFNLCIHCKGRGTLYPHSCIHQQSCPACRGTGKSL